MSRTSSVHDYSFANENAYLVAEVLSKLLEDRDLNKSSVENNLYDSMVVVRLLDDDDRSSDVLFDDIELPVQVAPRRAATASVELEAAPRPVLNALNVIGAPDDLEQLPDDDQLRIAALKESLHCVDGGQGLDLTFLASLSPEMTAAIWDELETDTVTEARLAALLKAYLAIEEDVRLIDGIVFTRHALLPKLDHMKDCTTSRVLSDALAKFASTFPQVAIEGLVVPLVQTQDPGKGTNELLRALIKDGIPQDHSALCLRHVLQESRLPQNNLITFIHMLVSKKGSLENSLPQLLHWILQSGRGVWSDIKFSRLLMDLFSHHIAEMSEEQLKSLSGVVEGNTTFLRRPLQTNLKKALGSIG